MKKTPKRIDAYTHQVLKEKYDLLTTKHWQLNGFDSFDQFLEEFDGRKLLAGPDDNPYEYRLFRVYDDLNFEPGNVAIRSIETNSNLQDCSVPAI